MNRPVRIAAITLGTVAVLVTGGNVMAGAWSVGGHRDTTTARSATVPQVDRPTVERAGRSVVIRWSGVRLLPGVPATGYRVIRHGPGESALVCEVGSRIRRCADVPPGAGAWTYTVRATFHRWTGPHSDPSGPVAGASHQTVSATSTDGGVDAGTLIQPEPSQPSAEPTATIPPEPAATESAEPQSGTDPGSAEPQPTAQPTAQPAATDPMPEDAERAPRR